MLRVDNIDLYYGASHALRHVSLEAEPGKVVCIVGRNGVGKTSTLNAIMGRYAPQNGDIRWQDQSLKGIPPFRRARLGFAQVPQGRQIFPLLTVEENLKTGFAALPRRDRFVPDEIYELFPILKEMHSRRGGDLSGGQQQQLAIGRALTLRPKLLVLDEPTEGIQPSIIKDIGRVILKLRDDGDMAIILVEQYFEFAQELADTIYVMDRGEMVMSGAAKDLDEVEVKKYLTV